MNPQTGEILAMVSLPSYDNNLFSGGISAEDYTRLINDPLSPLLNHAIGGEYPPGSTFKIVMANAGLEERVITPSTEFFCGGTLLLPNEFMPNDPSKAQNVLLLGTRGAWPCQPSKRPGLFVRHLFLPGRRRL